ncbi:MAG: type II secretion system protein [Elusimicrobia bacterium]|nr:type II secretion system protein [Elusimicrobiota bacterium]
MKISKSKKAGFTLVEMVVTLMIIVTLSLLSFPLYKGITHKKAELSEGYVLLGIIVDAQVAYYNEYGNFLATHDSCTGTRGGYLASYTCNDTVLGINAINNRYFTLFNINNLWGSDCDIRFLAVVNSKNSGTISMEYNVTQRFEPVVSGI